MKQKIKLSIIIVSYNTKDILRNCLESIISLVGSLDFEVIVVDNNSNDGSPDLIEDFKNSYDLKLIKNNKNIGFGAANNQGMKAAIGNYFLLLNSDTLINKTTVVNTLKELYKNDSNGVVGCKLVSEDGSTQSNGGYFPNLLNIFFWMTFLDDIKLFYSAIKPYHLNPKFDNEEKRLQDWITGAYFLIKRDVYKKVGGFDEDYFMYVEEMDYCYRIRSEGYKVIYDPNNEIVHLGGASGTSQNALINEFKGLLMFYKKHKSYVFLVKVLFKIGSFLRIIVFRLIGDSTKSKVYVNAFKSI